jgi:alcohol dehydrogenase
VRFLILPLIRSLGPWLAAAPTATVVAEETKENTVSETMRAARLDTPGVALEVRDVALPRPRPGSVRVRMEAAQVLPFTHAVLGGMAPFELPVPYTPGSSGIGTVDAVGDGVFGVTAGQRVYLDPYLTSSVPGTDRAPLLIGWFGLDKAAAAPQSLWRDGTFAEYAVWPAERVVPLGDLADPVRLAPLTYLTIAYGALLRADLRPGQHLIVTGATGNLGSAAVLVALAMGAGQVTAAGRNRQILDELAEIDSRVTSSALDGLTGIGANAAVDLAGGGMTEAGPARQALSGLRPGGTLVLAGGCLGPLELDYQTVLAAELTVRGAFMAQPGAALDLVAMIRAGTLRLDAIDSTAFGLDRVGEAVTSAAGRGGTHYTVLTL